MLKEGGGTLTIESWTAGCIIVSVSPSAGFGFNLGLPNFKQTRKSINSRTISLSFRPLFIHCHHYYSFVSELIYMRVHAARNRLVAYNLKQISHHFCLFSPSLRSDRRGIAGSERNRSGVRPRVAYPAANAAFNRLDALCSRVYHPPSRIAVASRVTILASIIAAFSRRDAQCSRRDTSRRAES